MGRWTWVRISRPPWKRFLKKSVFPHVKILINHSHWVPRDFKRTSEPKLSLITRPQKLFFFEQGMHFGALLTPVGRPDIVETIHLSRTCIVLVARLLWPCFVRAVVCYCSLFKLFLLLGFAVCFFLLKQLIGRNKSKFACLSKCDVEYIE